ncbi:hypothetical protein SELMODRAFT_417177 [Selaginella moellendorffii]|uniref:Uncharacterized protein n=1 Tax=Selaginella moellendorffii TaxID=88036 RepID=D8S1M1_SELML|nr:hypothetical protein SELMODRAFT_417177 [Selaginella moellendorffii]
MTSIELVDMMRDGKQRRQQRQQPVAEVPGKEKLPDLSGSGPDPACYWTRKENLRDFPRSARSGPADPSFSSCGARRISLIFQLLLLVLGLGASKSPSDYACSWSWHKRCKGLPTSILDVRGELKVAFNPREAHLTFQLQNWHRLSFSTNLDEREGVEKGCRVSRSESLKTIRQLMGPGDKLSFYALLVIYFLWY